MYCTHEYECVVVCISAHGIRKDEIDRSEERDTFFDLPVL